MAPIFRKHVILVGAVDIFCLACEVHLKSDIDTIFHIVKPVHLKHLKAAIYVEELKADGIKKIKNKYFCELCNKLLKVLARVRLHITEQTHIYNKNMNFLKRVGDHVIAYEKLLIWNRSWNGLSENSCAICNTEYESEEIHKIQSNHILNGIQIEVQFDSDKNIYRKIDEISFHCLTCNYIVLGEINLTSHFTGDDHKKQYQACCEAYNNMTVDKGAEKLHNFNRKSKGRKKLHIRPEPSLPCGEIKSHAIVEFKTITKEVRKESEKKSQPLKAIAETESASEVNSHLKVIEVTESASEVNSQKIANETEKAKEENTKLKYDYDENDESKICKSLFCNGYITMDIKKKTWCILCDWAMVQSSKQNISSHVNGKHHQTMLKLHRARLQKLKNNNKSVNNEEGGAQIVESDKISENLNELQKDDIIVKSESNTVACKKSTHVEFVNKPLEHKKKHVKKEGKSKVYDSCKESDMKKSLHDYDDHNEEIKTQNENYDAILEKLNEFQKNDVNVNFESLTAYCKKCKTNIEFVNKAIENHILEHKQKPAKKKGKTKAFDSLPKKVSDTKSLVTCPVFLKGNDTNNRENEKETSSNKKDDKVCSVISAVDTSKVLDALASTNDKENISKNAEAKTTSSQVVSAKTKKTKAVNLLKVPLKTFVHNVVALKNMMYKDVLINDKYCINFFCFCYMVQVGKDMYKCQACHESFRGKDYELHCAKMEHATAMHDTPVIANDDSEFIREIHPGSFLCGFCNMLEESWQSMEAHLRSSGHKECKNAASWRKAVYQPRAKTDDYEQIVTDSVAVDTLMDRFL